MSTSASASIPIGNETMSSALVTAKNFHQWTYDWIRPFIAGRVLDIGGGNGNHINYLTDFELVSVDISQECVDGLRQKHAGNEKWSFICSDVTDEKLFDQLEEESFDTVLSCNVFEHIPDDKKAFEHAKKLLKPGGQLVLVLPAHQKFHGDMDRLAGHFRRYDKATAAERLREAGFQVSHLRYVNMVGGIGWYINKLLFKHQNLSSNPINWQIRLFDRFIVPIIRLIEGKRSMPFGLSLICVGKKEN